MTDWASLNQAAAPFTSLTDTIDPITNASSVIFAGLQVNLSDVLAAAKGQNLYSITICADTLTVDTATVTAAGLVVVARSLDVSGVPNGQIELIAPGGGSAVAEFLIGGAIGAPALIQAAPNDGAAPTPIPVGTGPMQALLYTLAPGVAATSEVLGDAATLQDLAGRVWTLSSLQSSYTAAAGLMDSASADDRALAQSMFGWIVAVVGALGLGGAKIPSDFAEIYNQAGALLVSLNVQPGGYFVPVLSGEMYESGVGSLLNALSGYEDSLNTLTVETDIAKAVAEVSSTLQGTSQAEIAPLQLQLNDLNYNIQQLYTAIIVLRSNFVLQAQQANTDYQTLALAVSLKGLADFLTDCISEATNVVSLGVNVAKASEGDAGAVADGMKNFVESANGAIKIVQDLQSTPPGGAGLAAQAIQIMQMQVALMTGFQTAVILQSQMDGAASGDPLPSSLSVVQIDPGLAWDNYMAQAEAVLTSVKETIGSGDNAQAAQDAANNYLASLKILAGYGKAIDGKFTAYSSQVSQASIVTAQIAAAQSVVARWQQQEAQAKSDEEKLAILRATLEARANALKRSIFVAWTYYEAAYFYVHLTEPPVTISLSMTSAQLKDAFAAVSTWVAQLLGTAPDGQHVVLPNTDVSISFEFPIRAAGDTATTIAAGADVALLGVAPDGKSRMLSWSIPMGDEQLEGVLPQDGDVAIWITNLSVVIDGVTPNSKGNVIVSVATSGIYENGYGPDSVHDFFGQGLVGDYAYNTASGVSYIPWQIPTAVYMTPTPFTQWTMIFGPTGGDPSTATTLHLNLTVAYAENPATAAAVERASRPGRRRRSLRRAALRRLAREPERVG